MFYFFFLLTKLTTEAVIHCFILCSKLFELFMELYKIVQPSTFFVIAGIAVVCNECLCFLFHKVLTLLLLHFRPLQYDYIIMCAVLFYSLSQILSLFCANCRNFFQYILPNTYQ